MTTANRRLLSLAALAVAIGLLVLGVLYQADPSDDIAFTGGDGAAAPAQPGGDVPAPATDPIEGWFPQGGSGSACREKVGVDLAPGFQASLAINGIPIADEDLNEVKDPTGPGATLNHVTWGPEEDCPRGAVLRPEANRLEACVRRTGEPIAACVIYTEEFQAL